MQALTVADFDSFDNGLTEVNPSSVFNPGTVLFPAGTIGPPAPQSAFIIP